MKTLKLISILIPTLLMGLFNTAKSQVFLYEGFESGSRPSGWTIEYVSGLELWRYRNGGLNPNDTNNTVPPEDNDIARNPSSAYSGTYNAFFQVQGTNNQKTKLITPAINLEGAIKPELSFWLAQMTWNFNDEPNWDILRVYYKTAFAEDWILLSEFEDPIEAWTQVKINLPNPTSTYYIGFEGHSRWGYGVCIDEIIVEEKDILPRRVTQINVDHPSLTFVPTGSNNVPILRVNVKVYGNTGDPKLEEFTIKSLNTNNNDIKEYGVKLYYTTGQSFNLLTPLGSATSIVGGYANFENIDHSFPSGDSYIWVTYDVKDDATHGNFLDAMLEAESFLLNDTLYPLSSQSPPGRRTINKTVYFEDFEGIHNWSLTGEFQVDVPQPIGGTPGNPNTAIAYSGTKILGTDLTGLGANPGKYEPNLTLETANKAISPTVDLYYYKNIKLLFQRHLNVDWQDQAAIEASKDGGSSWTTIWQNSNLITESIWSPFNYTMPTSLERTNNFKLRYRLGPTAPTGNYSGWNIDDVVITAEYIAKDASVTEWVGPVSGCGLSETENVTIKVANLGGEDITTEFPVGYSLNGGITWVTANITDPILKGEIIEFTFPNTINLSTPGLRSNVRARTQLPGDQETGNNQLTTSFYVVPTYAPEYLTDFEDNDGYWRAFGANLWQYGTPSASTINSSASGTRVWATLLNQTYKQAIIGSLETIFFDGFETDLGWDFTGEFERGDQEYPTYPYEGIYYIGTDLTGQGANEHYYENNITPATAYTATSPPIDISNYNDVQVEFYRQLSIIQGDKAKFELSPDNGVSWITLWENNGVETIEENYSLRSYSIPNDYANSTQMRFRFSITETSAEGEVELGWNVDNFKVIGSPVTPAFAYLESPCFDLSESIKPIFEAKLWVETEADVDGFTLLYSINGGNTWEHFNSTSAYNDYWNWYNGKAVSSLGLDGWSGSTGGWITAKQLIPDALVGISNVTFRFAFLSDKHNNDYDGVAIDDFRIYEAPYDLGVSEILNLASACEKSEEEEITVRIQNFGIKNLPIGEKIAVGIDITYDGIYSGNNVSIEEEITLTEELEIGTTLDYKFASKFNLSVPGDYTISAFTLGETDPLFFGETSNDTTTIEITVQRPYIDLGPDIYTVLPDTVELVATSQMENITYAWYDSEDMITVISTSDKFMVPTINGGEFWVALENELECVSIDNIKVERLIADVGVSWFESPNSACQLSTETPFSVWVTNFGTDTLKSGYTITLDYQIDAEAKEEGINWLIDQTVLPGDSILYTFTGAERDMSAETTYQRKAWATIENDYDDTNDLLDKTITVWGYPTFTFTDPNIIGGTIEYSGVSYTMDAGGGWESYLWDNDGSTNQTFVMDTTGTVKVTVYDSNGCPDSDEVFIDLQFTSVGVGEVISPISDCVHSSTTIPVFRVQNLGTESVSTGIEVTFGYKLNDDLIESISFVLIGPLAPNESFQTNFSNSVDISAVGDYTFEFFATYAGDPKVEDDVLIHNVTVYGYPVVDLGDDVFTRAMDHLLDADGIADTYLWSTDETTKTITVDTDGLYTVTATNGGMCSDNDEVNVTFLRHDYGVSSILTPVTSCKEDELKSISVRFENFGNDTLKTGSEVKFGYILNSRPAVEQNYNVTSDLEPGQHFDFTFTQKVDLSIEGTYNITTYGIFTGDFDTSNDTKAKTFEIFELPLVYLGQDTVVRSGLITLDAGPDLTYLWNDSSTDQTLDVTVTGTYSVEVTNANGCKASHSISIISLTPDYGVTSVNTPNSGCSLSSAETVTVTFMNHGTDTLYEDDTIELKLYLNGVHQSTEEYLILEEFYPGDALNYTFTRKINLSTPNTYSVRAETYHVLDKNTSNNGITKTVNVWGNPIVTHDELNPNAFCQNNDPIELTGGNPSGGTYSGLGIEGTYFHPSIAGAGINVVNYSYVDPEHGCVGSQTLSITVLDLPAITFDPIDPTCDNADPITLTYASPEGGTYIDGIGLTDGVFYPGDVGQGTYSISYSLTGENGCTNTVTQDIVVNAKPTVTLDNLAPVCVSATPFALTGGNPTGGIYSGKDVVDNIFNPALTGVGTHTITYTFTNAEGCTDYATKNITVNPLPVITFSNLGTICIDSEPLELSGATPISGTYGGAGVNNGFFDPALTGIGTTSISYTFTDANGCTNSSNADITVTDLPVVEFAALDPVCFNALPVQLTGGTPVGGEYSADGVTDGYFNPAAAGVGIHTITYTYTDVNSCVNSETSSIEVYAPTTVTLSAFDPICVNSDAFELLGGSPAGGVYNGDGVNGGFFSPSMAGSGFHTITYSYTDANGCIYSANKTIEVYALTEVILSSIDPVCVNSEEFTLTGGSPLGGTYSGTGVTGGVFDPGGIVPGTHTITYTYTDANSCTNKASTPIVVHPLTNVSLASFSPVCPNDEPFTLTGGSPEGGVYRINGVISETFDPASVGPGTHEIAYSFTNANDCSNTATQNIQVFALTNVTLAGFSPVCANDEPFTLTGGSPAGGTYSIDGVSFTTFNPQNFDPGVYTVIYSHTDGNGCTNTASAGIEVYALPEVALSAFNGVCVNNEPFTLTGGTPAEGVYKINGETSSTFNPAAAGLGIHSISYSFTNANGCTTTASRTIEVFDVTPVSIAAIDPVCANAEPFTLSGGSPVGGTYSVNGVTVEDFNPADFGAGEHTVTYAFTNANGCTNTASTSVQVYALTNVTLAAFSPVCANDEPFTLTGGSPAGGTYSIDGVTVTTFNPQDYDPGVYTVIYSHTDGNGCTNTASAEIEVYALSEVALSAFNGVCVNAEPFTLTGGTPADGVYKVNGEASSTFNPAAAGLGVHSISYSFTNANGCTSTASRTIEVFDVTPVSIAAIDPVCANAESFTLSGGSPVGGAYSVNGVTVENFNPADFGAGEHTVTYAFTNANGCTNTASTSIQVYALTNVTLAAYSPVCANDEPFTLTGGSPSGGTYSIDGVAVTTFNPQDFDPGVYTVIYSQTDGNGCTNTAIAEIEVYQATTVTLAAFSPVCGNSEEFELTGGAPTGGVFSGNGVSDGYFDPSQVSAGLHTITYSYTDVNGCTFSASQDIEVFELEAVTLSSIDPLCFNAEPLTLTGGSPAGGIFSGSGVTNGVFNPSVAGAGIHTITYTFNDGNGCVNSATTNIQVYAPTTVTLATFNPVCGNDEEFELIGGTPTGGVFSGNGVSNGYFDPSQVSAGSNNITYTFTDVNGCTFSASQNIMVYAVPQVDLGGDQTVSDPITLDAGTGFETYQWQNGSSSQTFYVQYPGTYSVTVTNSNGCSGSDEVTISFDKSLLYITEVITPADDECGDVEIPVEVKIINRSGAEIASGQELIVRYKHSTNLAVEETLTLNAALQNDAQITYSFNQALVLPSGLQALKFNADYNQLAGQEFEHTVDVHPTPILDLGDDVEVSFPYILDAGISNVTYLWSTGSTERTITITQQGEYWLTVTSVWGCTDSDTINIIASSVQEIPGTGNIISVFPNPVKQLLNIDIQPVAQTTFTIELISPNGQRVYSRTVSHDQLFTHQVDVNNYSPGVYLLRVSSNGKWITVKVVVQR